MGDWAVAGEIGALQHYVVATWQLRMAGISNTAIANRVKSQAWRRRHRGVIEFPGPDEPLRRLAAAVLAYSRPPGAAVRVANAELEGAAFIDAVVEAALGCGQAVCGPFSGIAPLRVVLAELRGRLSHSATEAKGRSIIHEVAQEMGLSASNRPHLVHHLGRRVGEADVAVVELMLDFEIDGPQHLLPRQQLADQARDRLMRRAGWEVERFPAELIDLRPSVFQARVRDAIEQRLAVISRMASTR